MIPDTRLAYSERDRRAIDFLKFVGLLRYSLRRYAHLWPWERK